MSPPTPRACGSCTFCCKVMEIAELAKPAGTWCPHCRPGRGCGVYETRPGECIGFICQWLGDPGLAEAMKPDRVKVMFGRDGARHLAFCDPANPLAWRNEPVYGALKATARATWATDEAVFVLAGPRHWLIAPAADYDLGEPGPDATIQLDRRGDGTAAVRVVRGG